MGLMTYPISIEIPLELYQRLEKVAQLSGTSVEQAYQAAAVWLSMAEFPIDRELAPNDLANLSVVQLWAVVYQRLSHDDSDLMAALAEKNNEGTISAAEYQHLSQLVALVNDQMLLRSQALLLLKERGQDIERYRRLEG
jgi:hypothetical protein